MIIGVDPGVTGALAMVSDDIEVRDMPTCQKPRGRGLQVSAPDLRGLLRELIAERGSFEEVVVVVESVTSSPQMGVTSSFSFGRSLGVIEGVLAGMKLPLVFVTPQTWKKHHGLIGKDKDTARTIAQQVAPYLTNSFALKKHVGRAEALLIALWYGGHR